MKSGSVLYNFIDTKLNFDTNRLSAVCKHDICCTRIPVRSQEASGTASLREAGADAGPLPSPLHSALLLVMLIAKRSIILFGADVAGDKSGPIATASTASGSQKAANWGLKLLIWSSVASGSESGS